MQDLIWYASYGSNLLEERFLCYIRGGTPAGSAKNYVGCSDKTLPVDKEEIFIVGELYFAMSRKAVCKKLLLELATTFLQTDSELIFYIG